MKTVFPVRLASVFMLGTASSLTVAQDQVPRHEEARIDEIVVTSLFSQSQAETALPITVITGEELREKVTNSLGDTLKN